MRGSRFRNEPRLRVQKYNVAKVNAPLYCYAAPCLSVIAKCFSHLWHNDCTLSHTEFLTMFDTRFLTQGMNVCHVNTEVVLYVGVHN